MDLAGWLPADFIVCQIVQPQTQYVSLQNLLPRLLPSCLL